MTSNNAEPRDLYSCLILVSIALTIVCLIYYLSQHTHTHSHTVRRNILSWRRHALLELLESPVSPRDPCTEQPQGSSRQGFVQRHPPRWCNGSASGEESGLCPLSRLGTVGYSSRCQALPIKLSLSRGSCFSR